MLYNDVLLFGTLLICNKLIVIQIVQFLHSVEVPKSGKFELFREGRIVRSKFSLFGRVAHPSGTKVGDNSELFN